MVRVRYSFGCRHTGRIANIKKQRGKYPDVMREVVRISDIILEILDARYIEETRNLAVEEDVLKKGKVLVYVFNKSDLIDVKEMEAQIPSWMRPYVFISATNNIGLKDIKARIKMEAKRILAAAKSAVGSSELGVRSWDDDAKGSGKFSRIEDEKARKKKAKDTHGDVVSDFGNKKRIHVGVIGYPNAGKSSVINFITRRGVAKTAKQAGFTKGMQKIRMSENILILDTPGVIPAGKYSTESKSFAQDVKVGGRTYSDVKDPEDVVYYLISAPAPKNEDNVTKTEQKMIDEARRNCEVIEGFYGFEDLGVEEFIEELGKKKGFLGKGGKVDVDRTARIILKDWQIGAIGKGK